MISFDAVSKGFRDGDVERAVVADLSFEVASGEIMALIGPSGSGKTTVLNLLAGIEAVDTGDIRVGVAGEVASLASMNPAARARFRRGQVGYIFQFFNLIPTLTVEENLLLPLELSGRGELRGEALARLDALGLADRRATFPEHLSGGEQQRVAIARALAHRPSIILADEPTGNLDTDNAAQVVDLLFGQVEASGATLLIATHSERIAQRVSRRVVLGL